MDTQGKPLGSRCQGQASAAVGQLFLESSGVGVSGTAGILQTLAEALQSCAPVLLTCAELCP